MFLPEVAVDNVHILGKEQLSHFADLPFQLLFIGCSNGNEKVKIIEIFVIGQAIFEVIAAPDRVIDLIKISVGIAGILYFRPVDLCKA